MPTDVSRTWVKQQLGSLQAKEIQRPCTEPNTVSSEDAAAYASGLKDKLARVGDIRLQISYDEFSASVDMGSRTLLHRSEPSKKASRGNKVGQTEKLSHARESFTAGVCFSPGYRLVSWPSSTAILGTFFGCM